MKKATFVIKVMVVIISLIVVLLLFRNCSSNVEQKVNENGVESSDSVISEEELQKKQYENMFVKVREFERLISSETEIIILTIKDNYVISHQKIKDSFLNLFNSRMSLDVVYTAIISIPTKAIQMVYGEENIKVYYDLEQVTVKSIEIESITSNDQYGLLAKKYSHYEISALTLLATDRIREEIGNNEIVKVMAEQNLIWHIKMQGYKLFLFNITVVRKENME